MGVIVRTNKGETMQLVYDLPFKQVYSMVVDLRSKRDGNYYWIGTI